MKDVAARPRCLSAAVVEELSRGTLVLGDGVRMPRLGFGTAGSRVSAAVLQDALRAGLRGLDTAVKRHVSQRKEDCVCAGSEQTGAWKALHRLQGHVMRAPCDAEVPVTAVEPDPVTLSAGQTVRDRCVAELRAAPPLAVMPPGRAAALGGIGALRRQSRPGEWCNGKRCEFGLDVIRPQEPEYSQLVQNMSAGLVATLRNPLDSMRMHDATDGKAAAQHILSVRDGGKHARLITGPLRAIVEGHIKPLLVRRAFVPGAEIVLKKATASRNINDFPPDRYGRMRSMLWHYDGLREGNVKVILYLTDVDHLHGCMVAMQNASAAPYTINPQVTSTVIGGAGVFPTIPALWLSELSAMGYEPVCLGGAAGTLVIFDLNIVHRGSRPASGLYRDFVLFEFCTNHVRCNAHAGLPRNWQSPEP